MEIGRLSTLPDLATCAILPEIRDVDPARVRPGCSLSFLPFCIWEQIVSHLDRTERIGIRLVCKRWRRWVYQMEDRDTERQDICPRKGCGNRGARMHIQENAYVASPGLPSSRKMPDYILDKRRMRLICDRCRFLVQARSRPDTPSLRVFFFASEPKRDENNESDADAASGHPRPIPPTKRRKLQQQTRRADLA